MNLVHIKIIEKKRYRFIELNKFVIKESLFSKRHNKKPVYTIVHDLAQNFQTNGQSISTNYYAIISFICYGILSVS